MMLLSLRSHTLSVLPCNKKIISPSIKMPSNYQTSKQQLKLIYNQGFPQQLKKLKEPVTEQT